MKPSFFRHLVLFQAEQESGLPLRVAYSGLWTACDREGRFRWVPEELKLDCLPYDTVDFSRVLDALWTRGFIVKYVVDDKEYGLVPTFKEHQIINNRESDSFLPEPNENNMLTRGAHVKLASVTPLKQEQGEGKGKGREGKDAKRATQISKDFIISEDLKAWTLAKGLDEATMAREFEKFRAHHESKGTLAKNWDATWRTWVLKHIEWNPKTPSKSLMDGVL